MSKASKVNKKIILFSVIAVLIIGAVVALGVLFFVPDEEYYTETDVDGFSDVSYNGVSIVNADGLYYLFKDNARISDGYEYIKSFNDYYSNLRNYHEKGAELKIYDWYLAREVDSDTYYILSSAGEKYAVAGGNYSLVEVKLPFVVFLNKSSGRKAVFSLDGIDSDLSHKGSRDLSVKEFDSVEFAYANVDTSDLPVRYDVMYAQVIGDKVITHVYNGEGKYITEGEKIQSFSTDTEDGLSRNIYFFNADTDALYFSNGSMIATNVMFREMGEGYGYVICADKPLPKPDDGEEDSGDGDELPEGEGEPAETPAEPPKAIRLTVFTDDKNVFSFSAEEYDLESVVHIDGAIVLKKVDGSAVTAVNCLSGESGEYKELHRADPTLLVMNAESGYIYLDRYARPIMESRYDDMENVLVYEDVNILFSASFAADKNNVSRKDNLYYHIASFGKTVKELELKRTETMEPGENHDGEIGWFILTGEDGKKKLFTPLADNLLSESYDSIDTYTESRIGFVIGRDVRNRRYDVIDVFTGAVVASIPFSKEGDERLQISSSGSKYSGEIDKYNIASVPGDPNSVIPLDIVQVRKLAKDKTTAENITYYAVYRSAAYGDGNYLGAKLCFTELGTDYIMKESFELSESFARNNLLPFITPAGAQIYSFDAEKKLVRLGETEYEIDSLVSDTDSEKLYFRITNGCGGYGLANIDGSVIISPVYESIGNTVNGEYITARRGDAYGILRMEESGVTVAVDFVYSGISALVDGGFWAYNSNNDYVFIHNGRIEIRKPVSNRSITVYNYVQDENGTRVYEDKGLSYGGSYYFHKATYPQKLNVKLDLGEKYR